MGTPTLLFAAALLALFAPAQPAAAAAGVAQPALVLEAGSIARRQLVAVGRDLEVRGDARADAVVLDGSVAVSGTVAGDVIALGGDVRLDATARIDGDVFVLGGRVRTAPGAAIGGRTVSYPDASAAWVTLIEGPSLGLAAGAPVVLAAKLALLAAWLVLVIVLFATAGREMLSTSRGVAEEPLACFVTGVVGILALFLTALLFSAFAAALVGVPLLALAVLAALVLKLWGVVAVCHALGDALARRLGRRPRGLDAATVGLLLLGATKFVPYLGIWVWSAITFVGVGAALRTKLGRREPWFEPAGEGGAAARLDHGI